MNKNYDQLLKIQTSKLTPGFQEQSHHYSPYEATPYPILYTLFNSYELTENDVFVDFGCGKGRIIYYVQYLFNSFVVGIEMNKQLYKKTLQNKKSYIKQNKCKKNKVTVVYSYGEKYLIQEKENIFYFFNPFSVDVLAKVIENILISYMKKERTIDLIFYYPFDTYIQFLNENTPFTLYKEVKIPSLYERNQNERFLIYRINKNARKIYPSIY